MKGKLDLVTAVLCALVGVNLVVADDKTFTDSGQIVAGEHFTQVFVYGANTVVEMTGGVVDRDLNAHEKSTVTLTGGTVGLDVSAFESSTVNLYRGATIVDDIFAYESSTVNLYGGSVGDVISVNDQVTVNLHGGSFDVLYGRGTSILNLRGGQLSLVHGYESSTVDIHGYHLHLSESGGVNGFGVVTGFWQTDDAFEISLGSRSTLPNVVLHDDGPILSPGDANGDRYVDDDDLSVLLSNYWASDIGWSGGDFSGDEFVADNDLSLLLANWTGPTATVPGPAPGGVLAFGMLLLHARRHSPHL